MYDITSNTAGPDAVLPLALRDLLIKVALQPEPQLRFLSMIGLVRILPQDLEEVIELEIMPSPSNTLGETAISPGSFPRDDGSCIVVDPDDQMPRHDLYLLVEDVAALTDESMRRAAFTHIILCILVVPGWVAW